ncbi:PREDICTED: RING finger protein nhl-1-like isoform X1 [Papilio xuthus]|uniref:RING finger protein nhl-1-like isoform X1 n=1 Tax=Papilio xuthus TaxID=66420 RepID=A0AAJ6Z1E1_PAPXU|nr:PREDICTED: RING finger protein nhl-1-like isoform X1 [Papilio xuthus]
MAERVKKKPPFFTLKRWNSQKQSEENNCRAPITPIQNSTQFFKSTPSQTRTPSTPVMDTKPRKISAGGIKELVQCPLCLEVLHNPKMLPCQHTFCQACLTVYVDAEPIIDCPICCTRIQVQGTNFVDELPSNLYIDTLLQMVGISTTKSKQPVTPPSTPAGLQTVDLFAGGSRCSHCRSMCDTVDVTTCEHCKLKFCKVCWSQHIEDMRTQIGSILKQLDSAANRLEHKIEYYKDRCERITEQINIVAEEKINAILEAKGNLLQEASELTKAGDMSALALQSSLQEAKEVATKAMTTTEINDDNDKVTTFINLHQNALQLLTEVSKWDANRFVFDKENFCIESDAATPLDAESDDPLPEDAKHNNPLENEDSLTLYYRSRNFTPHYVWRKTARPCGVGIGPWSEHLYICATDSHSVLVVERAQARTVMRLSCEDMLCPVHIAFLKNLGEIYVTDKWKHCIHVFSKDGEHLRSLGQKGSRVGQFRSPEGIATDSAQQLIYIVDTGNDRVQILQPDGKFVDQIGVATKQQSSNTASVWDTKEILCTELNAPTAVAISNDRVIVLDSGNRRVKVYNKQDKSKVLEFGSLGQRKGQFRQPEVLAVDPLGFILVGDSGNCRVQVFKPNGQLVRVFGRLGTEAGKFGWISGIHVTKQLDIIVSDTKNHSVNFF